MPARVGPLADRWADTVGGEHKASADRRVLLAVHEDRAATLEVAHDVTVVHDLLTHVNRRAPAVERHLDRVDGTLDSGAVAARCGEHETAKTQALRAHKTGDELTSPNSAIGSTESG